MRTIKATAACAEREGVAMADESSVDAGAEQARPWPSPVVAWSAVAVLLLAYAMAYVDRAILTILVEPIQADLHINDTQIALLHGFAFVIFYVSLGIPLGYLADRGNRKWLVVGSIAVWSAMTAACGFTRSFAQLFAARIGVGVGEAGLSPASYSIIADYFPPTRRSAALGVYTLGIYLGSGAAIIGGGVIIGLIGGQPTINVPLLGVIKSWQAVFMVVGAPGLLVAALAATVREPARRIKPAAGAVSRTLGGEWSATWIQLLRHPRAYGLHTIGFAFLGVPFNVTLLWARPFLSRHFGQSPTNAAYVVGLMMLVFASLGVTLGSAAADRLQRRQSDATIRIGLVAAIALLIPVVALPFMPTLPGAIAALGAILFFGAFAYGAAPAALQLITPNRMRAMISAIYLVLVNLIGLMAGPVATGALTDYVFHDHEAVGYSAAIVCAASVLIAALAFIGLLKPFRAAALAEAS